MVSVEVWLAICLAIFVGNFIENVHTVRDVKFGFIILATCTLAAM